MMSREGHEVTQLLAQWRAGDRDALDRLIPLVYDDLRRIARLHLSRERPDHTLDTSALVHESYLQLVGRHEADWQDRAHFFAAVSTAMRHILVDYARRKRASKRGGGDQVRVSLEDVRPAADPPSNRHADDLILLDQALTRLGERDPRMVQVVECRYFGGMPVRDTAEALGISTRTVERDWTRAKAYLYQALG